MSATAIQTSALPFPRPETDAERKTRIQREALMAAQAEADIDAGLGIDGDDLEAWLDQLDHDEDAPVPASRSNGTTPR